MRDKQSRARLSGIALGMAFAIVPMLHAGSLPDLGTLSGKVTASKPFQAAQVYIRNVDKHVLYVVYTSAGHYEAVDLLPGKYAISPKKKGFSGDVKNVEVKPGSMLTA